MMALGLYEGQAQVQEPVFAAKDHTIVKPWTLAAIRREVGARARGKATEGIMTGAALTCGGCLSPPRSAVAQTPYETRG